jgi:hypothetical protein
MVLPDLNSGNIGAKLVQYCGRGDPQILLGLQALRRSLAARAKTTSSGSPPFSACKQSISQTLSQRSVTAAGIYARENTALRVFSLPRPSRTARRPLCSAFRVSEAPRTHRFIKPVGQRFVDVEGKRIDEDS